MHLVNVSICPVISQLTNFTDILRESVKGLASSAYRSEKLEKASMMGKQNTNQKTKNICEQVGETRKDASGMLGDYKTMLIQVCKTKFYYTPRFRFDKTCLKIAQLSQIVITVING